MPFKITEYPAKTVFNDGDLYDVSSFDGVSTYTSEKMTLLQLKTELSSQNKSVFNKAVTGGTPLVFAHLLPTTDVVITTFDGTKVNSIEVDINATDMTLNTSKTGVTNVKIVVVY